MEKSRVLIVGVGSIGERHVRCFLQTGRVSVAVVDTNRTLRDDILQRYGLHETYDSIQSAATAEFSAAVICTPAHLHVPLALELAERGVHLLIEKPLSTSLDGVEALLRATQRRRLVAAVAYVYRCHPALVAMRAAIGTGRFGKPVQIVIVSGQHFPTYRPAYRNIYYADRSAGGGAIQDALTHLINAAEWLVGPVTDLAADADHLVLDGVQVEDTVHVLARHGSVLGIYSLNQYQAPNETTLTVVCERGTLRFEFHQHRFRWMSEPEGTWHQEEFCPLERDALFVAQANSFLSAIEGALPLCSLSEGIQTLRANLAIMESAAGRTWTSLSGSGPNYAAIPPRDETVERC